MKNKYFFVGIASGVIVTLLFQMMILGTFRVINLNFDLLRGTNSEPSTSSSTKDNGTNAAEQTQDYKNDAYNDFEDKVTDVLDKIDTYYLEDVDNNDLYEEAIRGLVDSVGDPYTSYFTKDEYASFMEKMEGSYEGIGVVVSYGETEDIILVVAPFKNSPGEIAGVKPKDQIIAVDGVDVIGMSLDKVVELIKGEKGTTVILGVRRGEEELDISIKRDIIEIPTIEYKLMEDKIGYIGMSGFDRITEEQFKNALADLEKQGQEGLIIDLRNNPGGYLDIVYAIVDELLKKDMMVVYTEDKAGNRDELITKDNRSYDKPLVILINSNSASASEILAGAIKDHEKGVLVGETTFGKGLVQRTFDLDDRSAIKITISKYYTPDGYYIHGVGIKPDVEVVFDPESETDNQLDKAIEVVKDLISKE